VNHSEALPARKPIREETGLVLRKERKKGDCERE